AEPARSLLPSRWRPAHVTHGPHAGVDGTAVRVRVCNRSARTPPAVPTDTLTPTNEGEFMAPVGVADKVAFVWKVADKLRGTFKQHEYGSVMLPLLVLRRMDAVLAPTKEAVLDQAVTLGA